MKPRFRPDFATLVLWGGAVLIFSIGLGTCAIARGQESRPAPTSRPAVGQVVRMKVTAYCPCEKCCGKWAKYAKTACGDDARICDGVAADFKLLPKRTLLEIPGAGVKEVDDTGGAMRKSAKKGIYHIDIRFPTHRDALKWGVQWLDVKVLSPPELKRRRVETQKPKGGKR